LCFHLSARPLCATKKFHCIATGRFKEGGRAVAAVPAGVVEEDVGAERDGNAVVDLRYEAVVDDGNREPRAHAEAASGVDDTPADEGVWLKLDMVLEVFPRALGSPGRLMVSSARATEAAASSAGTSARGRKASAARPK
jgi:hypothetical protein